MRTLPVAAVVTAAVTLTGCSTAIGELASIGQPPHPAPPSTTAGRHLAELTVAPETDTSSYDRDAFEHWEQVGPTHTIPDNCDAREAVLLMNGATTVDINNACEPTTGSWTGAYTGTTIRDDSDVDMDHLVPLEEAWRSGADTWTESKRTEFANDLGYLRISTQHANRSKGSQDPAEWLPELHTCRYAATWIAVKTEYGLTVDTAERDALNRVLASC